MRASWTVLLWPLMMEVKIGVRVPGLLLCSLQGLDDLLQVAFSW